MKRTYTGSQGVPVEAEIGHTFKKSLPIYQIKQAVEAGEQPSGKIGGWCM